MREDLIIIDTNVLLSGLQSNKGQSFKLLQKLLKDEIRIGISVPLVLEYEKILKKQLSRTIFTTEEIDSIISYLCKVGVPIKVFYLWRPYLRDPYDDHILEVALSANCKYIVTYNKKDFTDVKQFGIEILSPYEFLERIGG